MVSNLQCIPINLHKSMAAASALCKRVTMERIEISLIQESSTYRGKIRGLNILQRQLHYCSSVDRLRACILTRGVGATSLSEFSRGGGGSWL